MIDESLPQKPENLEPGIVPSEESGGRGEFFEDPHRIRSDARLITQMMTLGVVPIERAAKLMRKGFELAENADARGYAAILRSFVQLAKLEQQERRPHPISNAASLALIAAQQKPPEQHVHQHQHLHVEMTTEERKLHIEAILGDLLSRDQQSAGQPTIEGGAAPGQAGDANGHGPANGFSAAAG